MDSGDQSIGVALDIKDRQVAGRLSEENVRWTSTRLDHRAAFATRYQASSALALSAWRREKSTKARRLITRIGSYVLILRTACQASSRETRQARKRAVHDRPHHRHRLRDLPALALTLGVVFANHLEPRILGLPFVLAWIVIWVLLTPAFMWVAYRSERA